MYVGSKISSFVMMTSPQNTLTVHSFILAVVGVLGVGRERPLVPLGCPHVAVRFRQGSVDLEVLGRLFSGFIRPYPGHKIVGYVVL